MANDTLSCGNCGYDGGLAHEKEKAEWLQRLHKAELRSSITESGRNHRYFWTSLTVILVVLIASITSYTIATRKMPQTDAQALASNIKEMYINCVGRQSSPQTEQSAQSEFARLSACNAAFRDRLDQEPGQ